MDAQKTGKNHTRTTLRYCRAPEKCRQPKIANLDNSSAAIHEDIVALQISVYNGRIVSVKVNKALQNLPCPPLQSVLAQVLVLLAISVHSGAVGSERWSQSAMKR
jgi:hypothetical protein